MAQRTRPTKPAGMSSSILLQIVRAEDERRWDDGLKSLLSHNDPAVRARAALAAGRIGAQGAVEPLADMVLMDRDSNVRQMAAFALGELELPGGAFALITAVKDLNNPARARAIEGLGKIAAAYPAPTPGGSNGTATPGDDRLDIIKSEIVNALKLEDGRRSQPDRLAILLGLTAVLRSKPDGVGPLLKRFLEYNDARVVADALNTLARLRLKDGNEDARRLLTKYADPIVRANAARVLGVTEDKQSTAALLDRALHDADSRVGVSAMRALASVKDPKAAAPLIERGEYLLRLSKVTPQFPIEPRNEMLEIATALGRILQGTGDEAALGWLDKTRDSYGNRASELEIASARISPAAYLARLGNEKEAKTNVQRTILLDWRAASALAQGLGEFAALPDDLKDKKSLVEAAQELLRAMIDYRNSGLTINTLVAVHSEYAIPEVLRAFARFKSKDLAEVLRGQLREADPIVRSTAAELLAELPADNANEKILIDALPRALADKDLNDAALSILDALAKQKTTAANDAIKSALNTSDILIRQRAVARLKENGAGDFSARIGTVQTRNAGVTYVRAIARIGKKVTATVVTNKGPFTIEFLPEEAPLTVDNFVQLARKGYFNGQTVPRVVPNFVIQAGDPRGDQNGGPGYQIRCEINEVPYDRAAVGMALSGKDTGGSQWFVTHSPQPHLDGGYTVFGRVVSGMDVVDRIARGDTIRNVIVNER